MGRLGIFGGTSLLNSSFFSDLEQTTIHTPHGKTAVYLSSSIVFIQRHHSDASTLPPPYRPPHSINYRANISAMKKLGVDRIVAICSVGSLNPTFPIGTMLLPDDYFYLFGPSVSYYNDARAHIVPSIDPQLRKLLLNAAKNADVGVDESNVTYVQTVGPRFETKAEVRFLTMCGDIVGMTAATEATMSKELGLPYAILAMVDNMANGLQGSQLTEEQFRTNVKKNQNRVEKAVQHVVREFCEL